MRKIEPLDLIPSLESGFAPVPFQVAEKSAVVRTCLIVRREADPASGHFVLLRRLPQATVYLGCLADAAGHPLDWLEIWVQNTSDFGAFHSTHAKTLTNTQLDAHWAQLVAVLRDLHAGSLITSGLEAESPRPTYFDLETLLPVELSEGAPWTLCRDEERLKAAGLPSYALSLARYLYQAPADADGKFVPLNADAPAGERTISLPVSDRWVSFNPAAGRVLIHRWSPFGLEEFTAVLAGEPWHGVANARKVFRPGGVYALLENEDVLRVGTTHLFAHSAGRGGRLAETLHLKLNVVLQAFTLVADRVRRSGLPLLNVNAETFRVSLGAIGLGLPLLWTARLTLDTPGQAFALPVATSTARYFQSIEPLTASIYRPAELASSHRGFGSVRLRKILPKTDDGIVVEGTLTAQERLGTDESQLLAIQLPLSSGAVELLGYRDSRQAMAEGEALFRTVPQHLPEAVVAALNAVAGVPFAQVPFSILPLLSTPADLYSLGVLATRILLVHPQRALPDALDAVLSLARAVASHHDPASPLGARIAQLAEQDPRWLEVLGPQYLRAEPISSADAAQILPLKLWWDIIGTIVRCFPGLGPDSYCRGFGDAPALALESVFRNPIADFDTLALRARSLILLEWTQNREIADIVHELAESFS